MLWTVPAAFALSIAIASLAGAQARWVLKETLRIGGAESGPALFVQARSIDVDAKGRILVFERSTQDIRMFGPDGKHLRTFGRVGSGPGEMRNAEGIVVDKWGKIWVRDAANGRFTIFNAEGEFEKNWIMKFCWSQGPWFPQVDRQNRIIDHDCVPRPGAGRTREDVVVAYRGDQSGVDTLWAQPECGSPALAEAGTWITRSEKSTMYRQIPFAPFPVGALGPGGETWCAPTSSTYEIMRLVHGTKDTVRIRRSLSAVPVTKSERDSIIATFEKNGPSGLDFDRLPRSKPVVSGIKVDDQGRVWVRRVDAAGVVSFDVYGASGEQLASVEFGKYRTGMPFVIRGDAVYAVVLDEDDVQHVVRFSIVR